MSSGWIYFFMFIALIATFAFAIWFNLWIEGREDEWLERQLDENSCPSKVEPDHADKP